LTSKGDTAGGRDQDDGVFVPLATAKLRLAGATHQVNRQSVHYVLVKTTGPDTLPTAQQDIRRLLSLRHRIAAGEAEDFTVRDLAATHAVHQESSRTLGILLAVVASISLVVGGVGIMNTMLVSVAERTREIGLRMAVGARPADIRNQFLVEALIVCLFGGLAGVIVGAVSTAVTAAATGWPVFLGPGAVFLAAAFAAAVGIVFGLYPALKAARLSPIDALRRE
jgi:putative ABC transport system permease protein